MKSFLSKIMIGVLLILLTAANALGYTLEDYSLVGLGNTNGFRSEYFTPTSSEPITTIDSGTRWSSTDLTFFNISLLDIQSLIITYEGMAQSTVIDGGDFIESF